jgi:hypothetical protein
MRKSKGNLHVVEQNDAPREIAGDIYAKGREKAEDRGHWARVHIEADKRNLPRGLFGWLR